MQPSARNAEGSAMYGMVNVALGDFLCSRYGDGVWDETRARSRIDVDPFLTMAQYPDSFSFELIEAASRILGKPRSELLEEFGEFWISYAKCSGYGELMQILGSNLVDGLQNIDNLHSRVAFAFPDLLPPSFWVTEQKDDYLTLHYQSTRTGLSPIVIGLVRGLAHHYGQTVNVEQIDSPSPNHHRFKVVFS
jgi:hypothetical protein